MKTKVVFICLAIIGLFLVPNVCGQTVRPQEKTSHTISIVFPTNGVYWNDKKIASYKLALFLHYTNEMLFSAKVDSTQGLDSVDVVMNGYVQYSVTPPFFQDTITWTLPIGVFTYRTVGFIAHWHDGSNSSCEADIYKLF